MTRCSSVAGIRAVTVESSPWLRAPPAMFAVTRRAPGDRDRKQKKSSHIHTSTSIIMNTALCLFLIMEMQVREFWASQILSQNSTVSNYSLSDVCFFLFVCFFMCICFSCSPVYTPVLSTDRYPNVCTWSAPLISLSIYALLLLCLITKSYHASFYH